MTRTQILILTHCKCHNSDAGPCVANAQSFQYHGKVLKMRAGHIAPLAIFGESTLFAATGDKELKVPAPAAAENCYAAIIPRILQ